MRENVVENLFNQSIRTISFTRIIRTMFFFLNGIFVTFPFNSTELHYCWLIIRVVDFFRRIYLLEKIISLQHYIYFVLEKGELDEILSSTLIFGNVNFTAKFYTWGTSKKNVQLLIRKAKKIKRECYVLFFTFKKKIKIFVFNRHNAKEVFLISFR